MKNILYAYRFDMFGDLLFNLKRLEVVNNGQGIARDWNNGRIKA